MESRVCRSDKTPWLSFCSLVAVFSVQQSDNERSHIGGFFFSKWKNKQTKNASKWLLLNWQRSKFTVPRLSSVQPCNKGSYYMCSFPCKGLTKIDPALFIKTSHPLNEYHVICFHDWKKNREKKPPEKIKQKSSVFSKRRITPVTAAGSDGGRSKCRSLSTSF